MSNVLRPGVPVKAFFQEVVEGDIAKFENKSNIAKSGGGARDLRVNNRYWSDLESFFSTVVNPRERTGSIISTNSGYHSQKVSLMTPTKARPNECRICKISLIENWKITKQEFDVAKNNELKWFYLLMLDNNGAVWASKFRSDKINQFPRDIQSAIGQATENSGKQKIKGIINF